MFTMLASISHSRAKQVAVIVTAVVLVCSLQQAFVLFRAFNFGRLTGLLLWDDCAIVQKALVSLTAVSEKETLYGLVRSARILAPHSPLADAQAFFGLLLSNGNVRAPYFLSIWAPIVALSAILLALRKFEPLLLLALTIIFLQQPLVVHSLIVLKSDLRGGVLMAAAIFVLCQSTIYQNNRLWLLGASLLGLAIISKLTTFYFPVLAICVLLCFELSRFFMDSQISSFGSMSASSRVAAIADYLSRNQRRLCIGSVIATLPFVVFFAWASIGYDSIIGYIRYGLSSTWYDGLSAPERLRVYLPGGELAWGTLQYLLVLLLTALIVHVWVTGKSDSLKVWFASFFAALMFLLPLVLARTSGGSYGSTFLGVVMGGVLFLASYVGSLNRTCRVLVFGVASVMAFGTYYPLEDKLDDARKQSRATYVQLVNDIIARETSAHPSVLVTFEDEIAGYPNIALLHFEKNRMLPDVSRMDNLIPAADALGQIRRANFVLTLDPAGANDVAGYMLGKQFPASQNLKAVDHLVASQSGKILLKTYPWKNSTLKLYGEAVQNSQ